MGDRREQLPRKELASGSLGMRTALALLLSLLLVAAHPRERRETDDTAEGGSTAEPETQPESEPESEPEAEPETEPEPEPENTDTDTKTNTEEAEEPVVGHVTDQNTEEVNEEDNNEDEKEETNMPAKKCQKCARSTWSARHDDFCEQCSAEDIQPASLLNKNADRLKKKCRRCVRQQFPARHQEFC